jgi:Mce-associated membrane protein
VLVVVLALIALGAVVTAGALWSSRSDLQRDADQRDEVASVAGRFAEVLLSYDHEDLDASVDAVRELATADFADEYAGAFDAGLGGQIETLEATSSARIREVFVASFTGDTTRAVVIADSDIVSDAGSRATVGTYLDITLIRLDGRWQVDDVTSVANAGSRLSPVPGSGDEPEASDGDGEGSDSSSSTSSTSSPTSTTSAP